MRKIELLAFAVVVLSFAMAIYFYPAMPEKMASHWNAGGKVDGYMPKFWGLFLVPVLSLVLAVFFILIPHIDPLKANIEKFRKHYEMFILLFVSFMFYVYMLTILWNLNYVFNFTVFLAPAFGALFYFLGILVENAKQNWFIGIRTPWTMSSEVVWDKTHKLGGKVFKTSGALAALGVFFEDASFFFVIVPVILGSLYLVVYSYLEYQKLGNKKAKK